ncbi:MAG: flagellar brake protein [Rubrivivax sp.]
MASQLFLDTLPAALDRDSVADPWSAFQVHSAAEVLALLRQLRDSSVPVNLTAPGASEAFCTTLWAIDSAQGRISFSAADAKGDLKSLLAAGRAVAVAYMDSIKVQFDARDLELVKGPRASALQCPTPVQAYRFQRRDSFRVRTDPRQSPRALARHPARPDMSVSLRVLDVSSGGCGLLVPPEAVMIRSGSVLHHVRFELDTEARFVATVAVRHIAALKGDAGIRLGCEWEDMDAAGRRVLNRYIEMMQKRKRLLSLS